MEIPGMQSGSRDKDFRVVKFISWMTLVIGPIAYLGVVYFLSKEKGVMQQAPPVPLFYVLLGIAALDIFVIIPIMQKFIVTNPARLQRGKSGSRSPVVSLFTIRAAIISSAYIFGLMTFFMSWEITFLPYFYAIGILGSILYWPTRERFDAVANQLEAK